MYQTEKDQHYMNGRNHGLADALRRVPPTEIPPHYTEDYKRGYQAGYYSH